MQINIIGAGPIGSYTAYLLSKKGYQVNLFEEHQEIGQPVQCTGLLTPEIKKYLPLRKEFIINIIQHIQLVSPSNNRALINKKEYIIDRTQFDQYLANKAQNNGSQLYLNHHFLGQKDNHLLFKHQNQIKKIKKSITIGADGPLSKTAQAFKFPNKNTFYYGYQATIAGNFDPSTYQVHFSKITPKFFTWLVPENHHTARIGLATKQPNKSYFNKLIQNHKILNLQAGLIPIYNPNIKTQQNNTYLIGDAATQVKATTGGGLIPGLKAAQLLTKAIDQNKNYPQLWKNRIGKNLKKHLFIRNTLNKFNTQDYDYLIKTINKKSFKNFIQKYNRENLNLSKLTKILLKNPKLIYLIKHLF
ncbi:MAG: NAD(P)/FAD-dependent oxidoreductase [Nanoarchaeota archaeon]|nr:NAD(P)/FAD-dependent oxidoreductase [Nanoarchaeota archaeon]